MQKNYDMIIRIDSERAEVEVEQHSKSGVITRKNISPQSLSTCILTSRHDDESHPTGLLPEGCIAVVMEKKYIYYYVRYPELHADFSYYGTEYLGFPIPRLVFCFKYLPHDRKVAEVSLCVVKDERLTLDTPTYRYPFSNLHNNLNVCLGNNALPVYKDPARLHTLAAYILRMPKRENIRSLEESVIYTQGQKDQAASQSEVQKQTIAALTERYGRLDTELNSLEEKRFAGLDRSQMEAQLVELSGRYNAAVQNAGSTSEIDAKILDLQQKLAQRRAEQYQSKYTQHIAETNAKVQELGKQYQRQAQILKAFVPGISCPTCRRPVTERNLSEVQGALQEVIDGIVAVGKEQRAQLMQLQELDGKTQATFDQFQAEDIIKYQGEIGALTRQRASKTEDRQTDGLREQIQQLNISMEYGNLSQQEYDRLLACREELRQCTAELTTARAAAKREQPDFDAQIAQARQEIKDLKILISNVVLYTRKRAELTFEVLKMNRVEISLYDVVKSTGEQKAAFKFTYNGRRYDRLSLSEKIRAGMEVSELVKRLTGRSYPVFIDNMESVDDLANVRPTGQVIMAKCVHGAALDVRPLGVIQVAEQKAA